jgi:hypothetical protein
LVDRVTTRFHFNTFVFVPYFVHTKLTVLLALTFNPTLEHLAPSLTEDAADACPGATPQSTITATATCSVFFLSTRFIHPFLSHYFGALDRDQTYDLWPGDDEGEG